MKRLLFILILPAICYPQQDSVFILPELVIHQEKHGKIESYNFNRYDKTKFLFLNDSILKADPKLYNYSVKINEINKISLRNGTHVWTGAAFGAIPGFILGFIALCRGMDFGGGGYDDHIHIDWGLWGGVVFAIPAALAGGVVGLFFPKYDDYEVYKIKQKYKYRYIRKIFEYNMVN